MAKSIPRFTEVKAENVGKIITAQGFAVDIGDQKLLLQKIPRLSNIRELDAPLKVPGGWFASWPLRCTLNDDLIKRVKLGDRIAVMGKLAVGRERRDPVLSPGFHYVLQARGIEEARK